MSDMNRDGASPAVRAYIDKVLSQTAEEQAEEHRLYEERAGREGRKERRKERIDRLKAFARFVGVVAVIFVVLGFALELLKNASGIAIDNAATGIVACLVVVLLFVVNARYGE